MESGTPDLPAGVTQMGRGSVGAYSTYFRTGKRDILLLGEK
jgi:hypothetical protein